MTKTIALGIFCAAVLWPFNGFAQRQKIVVVQGEYRTYLEDELVPERSKLVADAVANSIEQNNEFTVVRSEESCESIECLNIVIHRHKSDGAIYVSVLEKVGQYEYEIVTADAQISEEWTGAFSETLDNIGRSSSKLITEARAKTEVDLPPAQLVAVQKTVGNKSSSVLFWSTVGITAAAGIGFGITQGLAVRSLDKLESDDWTTMRAWQNEKDKYDRLTIASPILFSIMIAGAIATPITAYFTFKKKKPSQVSSLIAPSLLPNGVLLVAKGTF